MYWLLPTFRGHVAISEMVEVLKNCLQLNSLLSNGCFIHSAKCWLLFPYILLKIWYTRFFISSLSDITSMMHYAHVTDCEDCITLSGCSEVSLAGDKQAHVQTCSESPIRLRNLSVDTFTSGLVIPIILLYCCRIKWKHQYLKILSSLTNINMKLKELW